MKTDNQEMFVADATVAKIDYLLWALAIVRLERSLSHMSPQFEFLKWRSLMVASSVEHMKGFSALEMETLLRYAEAMDAELRFVARTNAADRNGRVMYVTQAVKLASQNGLAPNMTALSEYLRTLCAERTIEELAWGAQLQHGTVRSLLAGQRTRIDLISRLLAAAGYVLHFWLIYDGASVGSPDFCRRFPHASCEAYGRERAWQYGVRNEDLMQLLTLDLADCQ